MHALGIGYHALNFLIIAHNACRSLNHQISIYNVLHEIHMVSSESDCTVMNNVSMVRLVAIVVSLFLMAKSTTCIVNLALVISKLCLGFDIVTHCMVWLGSLHHSDRSSPVYATLRMLRSDIVAVSCHHSSTVKAAVKGLHTTADPLSAGFGQAFGPLKIRRGTFWMVWP